MWYGVHTIYGILHEKRKVIFVIRDSGYCPVSPDLYTCYYFITIFI